ncbi:DUF4259 domain-containing protein [Roseibium sp. RKSG952]|uniref:DUF4259 domain-containing protein n=1 Tax=Roseibium sp. RKSG952 TaxID=2529384 RepID=UPI0012BB8F52|nr:DUF4259 domain-containing protein [Roseibium sp. RKSG952]MTI01861.1 DUF4259 domain-containing protein [Roseibium sp. RKSG952]
MGTWGPHSFENDTASDLLDQIRGYEQPVDQAEAVRESFGSVFSVADGYLDADEASAAVAGAEIVASALGQPRNGTTAPFDLAASFKFYDDTIGMALAAVTRVTAGESELAELWDETDEADTWRDSITDLTSRLLTAAAAHNLNPNFIPAEPEAHPEHTLRTEVEQVYDDMMSEIERIADSGAGDAQVEVLRHLVRKMNLIHKDITNMRYFVVDSLEALTDRIDGLEKKL